jgi:hypothetical protein
MACTIDWAALAAWVQAVILAIAAVIAYVQLNRFNDNERVKNTLALVKGYNEPISYRSTAGQLHTTTVASAMMDLANAQRNILEYKAVRDAAIAKKATPEQATERERRFNSIVIVLNFFASAGTLYKRKLLDNALFLDSFGDTVSRIFDWGASVSAVEQGRFDKALRNFEALAKESKKRCITSIGNERGVSS